MACLYIGKGVYITYMGIKEVLRLEACGFVPLVITIIVHMLIKQNILKPLQNLSLQVAADVDIADGKLENTGNNSIDDQLYAQPALKARLNEWEPMPYRHEEQADRKEEEDLA
jgi:hypothetical protein